MPEPQQDKTRQQGIDTGSSAQRAARVGEFRNAPTPLGKIQAVVNRYPEMNWLTGKTNATPAHVSESEPGKTIGETLFEDTPKADLTEFNRTAVGILTLDWILKGNYDAFTACQKPETKLSRDSFDQLQAYTKRILPDDEAVDAMVTYMVINDLGKINSVVEDIEQRTGLQEVDHDKVLLAGLEAHPDISPSYQSLSPKYKEMIKKGLEAKFNIGQFIQGENVPASLEGLPGLDKESLDFYLLHALTDIAGAAGQGVQNGSAVMTEPTYYGFQSSIGSLEGLAQGQSVTQVYDSYLAKRAEPLGLDIADPTQRAVTRLSCMIRASDQQQATELMDIFQGLPTNTKAIIEKELNKTGVDDGHATLLYYSPAMLNNLRAAYEKTGDTEAFRNSLQDGLTTMARVFQEARIAVKGREGNGVYTVMVDNLARQATEDPQSLSTKEIKLSPVGEDAVASLEDQPEVDINKFPRIESLTQIPGKKVATIGMGGGSDAIQAAMVGKLLAGADKTPACVISIRKGKTSSQSATGAIGEERTVQDHGGEIASGVYKIKPETTGSGRFLENIPAEQIPTYLVVDDGTEQQLTEKIQAALTDVGGIDTVISVDTGGDALNSTTGQDIAKATPDQDLRSLQAINKLTGVNKISCEIAVGVDSPPNAEDVLSTAKAQFYGLKPEERDMVLDQYRTWHMDGSDRQRYGKTALAWQAALSGKVGYDCLPLPSEVVLDERNPWNPYVRITAASAGMFFMSTDSHLNAINK